MPCSRPLPGWRAKRLNPATGKRSITFSKSEAFVDMPVLLPCGQCIFCRLEHSRNMAVRCAHEAQCYDQNCFVTLTYAPEHLPLHGFLDYEAPVLWMKRLRERYGSGIRSYGCSEYGEKFGRPHYHICLFNFDFPDKVHVETSKRGDFLYESQSLSELWPFGRHSIGSLTFESAAYVARYVTKKWTGEKAAAHYEVLTESGELLQRPPEKPVCVSRRPGVGKPWFEKFSSDCYPSDTVVLRGKTMMPPKYYDRLYELDSPADMAKIKKRRKKKAAEAATKNSREQAGDFTKRDRLLVKEECKLLQFEATLKRAYENDP